MLIAILFYWLFTDQQEWASLSRSDKALSILGLLTLDIVNVLFSLALTKAIVKGFL